MLTVASHEPKEAETREKHGVSGGLGHLGYIDAAGNEPGVGSVSRERERGGEGDARGER